MNQITTPPNNPPAPLLNSTPIGVHGDEFSHYAEPFFSNLMAQSKLLTVPFVAGIINKKPTVTFGKNT